MSRRNQRMSRRTSTGFPFTPVQLQGLVLWLRADLGITLNVNNVSAWADQSGAGNNASQGTGANQPLFVASGINGKPVVQYNENTTQFMSGAASPVAAGADRTIYLVMKNTNRVGVGDVFEFRTTSATFDIRYDATSRTTSDQASYNNTGTYTADGNPHSICCTYHAGSLTPYYLDGTNVQTGGQSNATNDNGTNGYVIGSIGGGGGTDTINTGEIIVYNSVHSAGQIAQVRAYLAAFWGFAA